jgi:hypothetical protein
MSKKVTDSENDGASPPPVLFSDLRDNQELKVNNLLPPPSSPKKKKRKVEQVEKEEVDLENSIPHVKRIRRTYMAEYEHSKHVFVQEIVHLFNKGVADKSVRFVICQNLQYKWQKEILDGMFLNKGYELVFNNIGDTRRDLCQCEIVLPGAVDTKSKFNI